MEHYTGSYFCTKSHWDGKLFDTNNLVAFSDYDEEFGTKDFNTLLIKKKHFRQDVFDRLSKDDSDIESLKMHCKRDCYYLKPEVMKWLNNTVKDTSKGEKGWCVGNDDYNSNDSMIFSVFFYRRRDALAFIKQWSIYKKPTETYNQNTYVKKKLNLKTLKLEVDKS